LEVKAIVMLQELISAGNTGGGDLAPTASVPRTQTSSDTAPLSSGRAVLALTAAVYGGYVGFTVHNASRSSDARLLYPLTALGAGLGLGGSMLVADEWNITQGSAWYLSAALVWPAVAGITLGEAYDGRAEYRYLYGVLGATGGLTLATTVISLAPTTPGQAALTHSGGAFGTLLGGLTEALINPELNEAPLRGMGYGAALGVLTLGALAPTLETSASRIVFIDLSASLGALTGAALATPLLLVGNDPTQGRSRFWFASVMAGTLVGGALGTYITRNDPDSATATGLDVSGPYVGFLGFSESATGEQRPLFGAELSGTW
jgi:hypothetical protein